MTVENSALQVTELDFDSIRNNLKEFLRSQDEFTDFDFEGSGMSVLLDILAYNTHYMAYQMNMVANESFLDSAQVRSSVLSIAKAINYVPASKKGATSKINIRITPSESENQITNLITLDKYTRLLGADVDGINYPFVTLNSNTAAKVGGTFDMNEIYIRQGEVITLQYLMEPTNTKRRFEIPSANVDVDTVVVTVQESSSNTNTVQYTLAEDLTEITPSSPVFFIEENDNLNYTVYFGDDIIGRKPKNGNIINITYLDTVGRPSNNITRFTFVEPVGGLYSDNVRIISAMSSYGGADKETIESARFRAPYFYTTQNRAVTKPDYETLLLKNYSFIDSISVWGGEDNDPVIYGKVFMSIKTKGNFELTNFEKEALKNELIKRRNVLTITPEIVDPDYVFVQIKGKVSYNPRLTKFSSGEIKSLVNAAVLDYNESELQTFDSTFKKSKLQSFIENADRSITGSQLTVSLQKRFTIDTIRPRNYEIAFNTPIRKSAFETRLTTFPELVIIDSSGVSRNIFFEEVPELNTGIDSITINSQGQRYLSVPTVTISGDGSGATARARIISGRVASIDLLTAGRNYTFALVTISGGDGSGASATARLQSSLGRLRSFYYKSDGEKVIVNSNAGTVDYRTGLIKINSLRAFGVSQNDFYREGVLTINAQTDAEIIGPLRNRIVLIDQNDPTSIQLDMVAQ